MIKNIASIIKYPQKKENIHYKKTISSQVYKFIPKEGAVGVIGAGSFVKSTVLPMLSKCKIEVKSIASLSGFKAAQIAKKNIQFLIIPLISIVFFNDSETNTVIVATRHDSHAGLVVDSLSSGMNTFVEKPLALTKKELTTIEKCINSNPLSLLHVGYNRRFSPHMQAIKKTLGNNHGPLNIVMTMNAGYIPKDHWVHDLKIGGGRIIGGHVI